MCDYLIDYLLYSRISVFRQFSIHASFVAGLLKPCRYFLLETFVVTLLIIRTNVCIRDNMY